MWLSPCGWDVQQFCRLRKRPESLESKWDPSGVCLKALSCVQRSFRAQPEHPPLGSHVCALIRGRLLSSCLSPYFQPCCVPGAVLGGIGAPKERSPVYIQEYKKEKCPLEKTDHISFREGSGFCPDLLVEVEWRPHTVRLPCAFSHGIWILGEWASFDTLQI